MNRLTQQEATMLIDMLKKTADQKKVVFPQTGEKLEFEVVSTKQEERFMVNVYRKSIDTNRGL